MLSDINQAVTAANSEQSSSLDILLGAAGQVIVTSDSGDSSVSESVREELESAWTTSPEPDAEQLGPAPATLPGRPLHGLGAAATERQAAPMPLIPPSAPTPPVSPQERTGFPLGPENTGASSATLEYRTIIQLMMQRADE